MVNTGKKSRLKANKPFICACDDRHIKFRSSDTEEPWSLGKISLRCMLLRISVIAVRGSAAKKGETLCCTHQLAIRPD